MCISELMKEVGISTTCIYINRAWSSESERQSNWKTWINNNKSAHLASAICTEKRWWVPSRTVTRDKTWVHHYDPKSKRQSTQWNYVWSPLLKKFHAQLSSGSFTHPILELHETTPCPFPGAQGHDQQKRLLPCSPKPPEARPSVRESSTKVFFSTMTMEGFAQTGLWNLTTFTLQSQSCAKWLSEPWRRLSGCGSLHHWQI